MIVMMILKSPKKIFLKLINKINRNYETFTKIVQYNHLLIQLN